MNFLKNLFITIAFTIAFLLPAHATQTKAPLAKVCFASACYYEYVPSGYRNVLSADTLTFYVDTANSYPVDPDVWLMDMNRGDRVTQRTYPGSRYPEKICGSILSAGDVDSSTMKIQSAWAASKTDTVWISPQDTASFPNNGHTKVLYQFGMKFETKRWFAPKLQTTSATDTTFLKAARFWPCDD